MGDTGEPSNMMTQKRATARRKNHETWCQRLYSRQTGLQDQDPWGRYRRIYSSIKPDGDCGFNEYPKFVGGIFNLAFSDDGKTLVAATERKKILVYDPISYQLAHEVNDAHEDCVNYVKFIDNRVLASCSDDRLVKLWDIRSLRTPIHELRGHQGWVKNIEYAKNSRCLVTSGFDGNIQIWDVDNLDEQYDETANRLMHLSGLMRMQLTPDESKMIVCTTRGWIMVIHDLDFDHFQEDLKNLKLEMFGLYVRNEQQSSWCDGDSDRFFTAKRNRIEFIVDFPQHNRAEVISSLQVHPKGWCIVTRNTSPKASDEWTCLHDIQEMDRSQAREYEEEVEEMPVTKRQRIRRSDSGESSRRRQRIEVDMQFFPRSVSAPEGTEETTTESTTPYDFPRLRLRIEDWRRNEGSQAQVSISESIDEDDRSNEDENHENVQVFEISTLDRDQPQVDVRSSRVRDVVFLMRTPDGRTARLTRHEIPLTELRKSTAREKLHHSNKEHKERLLYYHDEPAVGEGFIKELCFSPDGRIICSPYKNGWRFFGFDENCSELSECVPRSSRLLTEITKFESHRNFVVSSRFSPNQCLLVTGCLNGRINFHLPKF